MNCYHCNAYIRRGAKYCSYCGNPTSGQGAPAQPRTTAPQQMNAQPQNHGYMQPPAGYMQPPVGYMPQYPVPVGPIRQVSRRKRGTMLMLWLFTGVLGGHHFYVGNIGKGVLYLFTFGLSGIGWLCDFFGIVCGNPVELT